MDTPLSPSRNLLQGRKICVTGRLVSLTHRELASVVRALGGTFLRAPRRCSFELVVGENGWPSQENGKMSAAFDRARRLQAFGYGVKFVAEFDFLNQLGFTSSGEAIRGLHTLSDLSRILDVSTIRLRRWIRLGLICPVETLYQLPYFDFRQVAFAKQLHELIERGVPLANIRESLRQAEQWLTQDQMLSDQLANINMDGRVVFRLQNRLIDHTGQAYFDFEDPSAGRSTIFATEVESGIHDLCDQALALEEEERFAEAAQVYERALQLQPDQPTLHFDLGNVLFQLERFSESIDHFQQAVDCDEEFAMAWHNLGSVQAHLGMWPEAESCLRRALRLVPTYADSHYTLAEVLRQQDQPVAASKHHQAYLTYSKADCLLAAREQFLRVVHVEDDERSG